MKLVIGLMIFDLFVFDFGRSYAQTYTVPGAQIQPAWVFPMWFENGDGQRDTLYFCYDSAAGYASDTVFGQKLVPEDPALFHMTFDNLNITDSLHQKVFVGNNDLQYEAVSMFGTDVQLPLILRWDRNVFYSDSLPFPNIDPAPRAEGRLWFDLPTHIDSCDYSFPILMTDTVLPYAYCHKADSVIFWGTALSYLQFSVLPWHGIFLNIEEGKSLKDYINIFPNPFIVSTIITLTNYTAPFNVQLFDELGREVPLQYQSTQQSNRTTLTIDRGGLLSGMYFLSVASGEKREVVKVMVE